MHCPALSSSLDGLSGFFFLAPALAFVAFFCCITFFSPLVCGFVLALVVSFVADTFFFLAFLNIGWKVQTGHCPGLSIDSKSVG